MDHLKYSSHVITIVTPPQSPDINPIGHLWAIIRMELQKYNITSKSMLKEKILEVWNSISPNITEKVVNSMQNRLRSVITRKGRPTKY